ncbi:hypothetical protein ACFL2V_14810 [Pseudomonadota bacterium]
MRDTWESLWEELPKREVLTTVHFIPAFKATNGYILCLFSGDEGYDGLTTAPQEKDEGRLFAGVWEPRGRQGVNDDQPFPSALDQKLIDTGKEVTAAAAIRSLEDDILNEKLTKDQARDILWQDGVYALQEETLVVDTYVLMKVDVPIPEGANQLIDIKPNQIAPLTQWALTALAYLLKYEDRKGEYPNRRPWMNDSIKFQISHILYDDERVALYYAEKGMAPIYDGLSDSHFSHLSNIREAMKVLK